MKVLTLPINQINPAPYNPRKDLKPGNPEYERLKRSIDTFGCVEPLVWNKRSGNLVGGHQRFKVLVARGDRETDVSVVDLVVFHYSADASGGLAIVRIEQPAQAFTSLDQPNRVFWNASCSITRSSDHAASR